MAVAGKVAITLSTENGGAWSAGVTYDRLVAVKHNNNLYISRKTVTNVEPPNNEFWFLALEGYSGEDVQSLIDRMNDIITGTQQVGNAKTLDGHGASYFATDSDLIVERERISNLAKLNEGSTTGDAELVDIRVGANGEAYANAGDAVREQVAELKSDLIGANLLQGATLVNGKAWVDDYEVTNSSYNYYYGIKVVAGAEYIISPRSRFIYVKKADNSFQKISDTDATSFVSPVNGIVYITVYASDNDYSLTFTNADATLSQVGKNADAKATGDKLRTLNNFSLKNSLFAFAENYVVGKYYNGSAINNPTYNYYASIPVFKDHLYSFSDEVRFVIVEQNNVVKETYENIEYFTCLNDGVAFVTIRADKPNITMQRLILNDFFSSLTNKKMVCLGDSFTAGDTYVNKIAKRCHCVSLNYGVPSSRIVRDVEGAQSFNSRYSSMPNDADVVTIFGGINDAYDVKIGVLPMGTIESVADLTTFYGGMKKLIEGIIAKYPDKQIIGIVPPDCQVSDYSSLPTVQNAEREIYNYYGIPYIDIKRECYKMSTLPDMVALYRQDASNIHPSADGHVALADTIFAGLKRYLP